MTASTLGPRPATAATALLAGAHAGPVGLRRHRELHGPERTTDRAALVAAADAVGLLGRGGAAFPVARKLAATPRGRGTHVLVNASEGEPASRKDAVLLGLVPHLVLDGVSLVARALGTAPHEVTLVVGDGGARAATVRAVGERRLPWRVLPAAPGLVGGEVRALVRHADGRPARPPGRPELPSAHGVGGRPTFASNVETYARLALLAAHGPAAYGAVGHPEEPGTSLLTLVGDLRTTGVVEVPTDTRLADLLPSVWAPSSATSALLVGGYHGRWADVSDPAVAGLPVARPVLARSGLGLGAGVVARVPADACLLAEVAAVATWLAAESAGQCGPCVHGLPRLALDVHDLLRGHDARAAVGRHGTAARGACAHPTAASRFVTSALDVASAEVVLHLAAGCGRPYGAHLPVGPAPAPGGGSR